MNYNISFQERAKLSMAILSKQSSISLEEAKKQAEWLKKNSQSKKQEEKKLIKWIEDNGFWYSEIDFTKFVSEGADQKVYLNGNEDVIKLNDAIYYASGRTISTTFCLITTFSQIPPISF